MTVPKEATVWERIREAAPCRMEAFLTFPGKAVTLEMVP